MVREIIKDINILTQPGKRVTGTQEERTMYTDLIDTSIVHQDVCMGLAAIQLGKPMNMIAIRVQKGQYTVLINPIITWKSTEKSTMEEGCLSLEGTTEVTRPKKITVMYQSTFGGKFKKLTVGGVTAKVIQHEIDHLKGRLI